jgi:hypothetical protein
MKLNIKSALILGFIVSACSFADDAKVDSLQVNNLEPIEKMPKFIPPMKGVYPEEVPNGICVFDIDQTLIAPMDTSWPNKDRFPDNYAQLPDVNFRIAGWYEPDTGTGGYAREAFYECIKHGYGIALNTASDVDPVENPGRNQMLHALFGNRAQFSQGADEGLRGALTKGTSKFSVGGDSIYQYNVSGKGSAMVRIMRAYNMPTNNIEQDTKCVILFDDNQANIDNVKNYNNGKNRFIAIKLGMTGEFQAGVTKASFDEAVNILNANDRKCTWNN